MHLCLTVECIASGLHLSVFELGLTPPPPRPNTEALCQTPPPPRRHTKWGHCPGGVMSALPTARVFEPAPFPRGTGTYPPDVPTGRTHSALRASPPPPPSRPHTHEYRGPSKWTHAPQHRRSPAGTTAVRRRWCAPRQNGGRPPVRSGTHSPCGPLVSCGLRCSVTRAVARAPTWGRGRGGRTPRKMRP